MWKDFLEQKESLINLEMRKLKFEQVIKGTGHIKEWVQNRDEETRTTAKRTGCETMGIHFSGVCVFKMKAKKNI